MLAVLNVEQTPGSPVFKQRQRDFKKTLKNVGTQSKRLTALTEAKACVLGRFGDACASHVRNFHVCLSS